MAAKFLAPYPKEALCFFLREIGEGNNTESWRTKRELAARIEADVSIQEKIRHLLDQNPIWSDTKFVDCWRAAFPDDGMGCMKTSFGSCAYDKSGDLIAMAHNKRIGAACGISSPFCNEREGCVRSRIATRAEQTIGECNHSIIWLLADLFEQGFKPSSLRRLNIYEAGFLVTEGGKPWVRKVENYTCLYCVRLFLAFNLQTVWGIVGEQEQARWQAFATAKDYVELANNARQEYA